MIQRTMYVLAVLDLVASSEFYRDVMGFVSRGATLTKPLRDEPWGMREFGVKTIDDHRIMIGQELK